MIDGLLLDIGGVLTLDGAALPGAIDAVAELQRRDLPLRFLTNTSKQPRQAVLDELVDLGFSLQAEQLITAPIAVKQLLQQQHLRPFIISTPALLDDFSDIDTDKPNAVVIFDAAEGFCYQVLDAAFQVLQQGAPLIAVGGNRYYQSGGSLHLDAGRDRLSGVAAAQPDTRIVNGLSLPETMGLALSSDPRDPTGTITTTKGRPVGGVEGMIVDPRTGMDVLLYQTGEVWLRGTGVFLGYAGKPGAGFTDRFFRTGILGHLDSEGRLVLPKAEEEVLLSGW